MPKKTKPTTDSALVITANLTPWKKGQSGNPKGRAKGSRNKLSEAFISDIYDDWLDHGKDIIQAVRENDPAAFLRICASLIPKQFDINGDSESQAFDRMIEVMSDEDLNDTIEGLKILGASEVPH